MLFEDIKLMIKFRDPYYLVIWWNNDSPWEWVRQKYFSFLRWRRHGQWL